MSYMICNSIKKDNNGDYILKVACNNVYPREYDEVRIEPTYGDDGFVKENGLPLDKVVCMVYYGDVQFNSQALRCKWGRTIHNAINAITNGRPVWHNYGHSDEEEQKELRLCQRMAYTGVAQEK